MIEGYVSERELTSKLLEALQEVPFIRAHPPQWEPYIDRRFDARIDFEVAGKGFRLLIEIKKSVYPRDVRQILWQLKGADPSDTLNSREETVPFLAAESISPGAKELLRKEGVGYYDIGGSLFIPGRGAYLYIEKPPPKTFAKTVRSIFTGKRSQVLHALLVHSGEWFSVKALAELSQVSSTTVSETLTALERFDWIESKGQGPSKERRLAMPAGLLDEWEKQSASSRPIPYRRYYVPLTSTDALIKQIDHVCEELNVEYVLTQEAAAQFYAPFLTAVSQVNCRMSLGRAAEKAISELDARVVSEGANLFVCETKSQGEFLFKERLGSAWLASPVQVYLDLTRAGGRGKDMAANLRKERIGF